MAAPIERVAGRPSFETTSTELRGAADEPDA
jgi:hypothetical protein